MQQTPLVEGVDYMFPSEEDYNKGASVETLNKIYNASDCFITTATGEGWGLTITEAMACMLPLILPNHTSIGEIGGKNGEKCYFLEELSPDVHNIDNIIRFKCNIYEIAEVISQVEKDKKSHALDQKLKIEKGLKYVKSLDWHSISKIFSEDIKRLG
jgi:glycosyltransferase involved in cell wall biosynthesis